MPMARHPRSEPATVLIETIPGMPEGPSQAGEGGILCREFDVDRVLDRVVDVERRQQKATRVVEGQDGDESGQENHFWYRPFCRI